DEHLVSRESSRHSQIPRLGRSAREEKREEGESGEGKTVQTSTWIPNVELCNRRRDCICNKQWPESNSENQTHVRNASNEAFLCVQWKIAHFLPLRANTSRI